MIFDVLIFFSWWVVFSLFFWFSKLFVYYYFFSFNVFRSAMLLLSTTDDGKLEWGTNLAAASLDPTVSQKSSVEESTDSGMETFY